ncbi:MAG TPA: periplasmic heavy metal sensor [Acidobacteriaceae bacterium]|jgi:Spy/CpxP family protein refolding chaperone|nr:periplasmic heavy metal sensor [Acidobacteriaceae bacterium]
MSLRNNWIFAAIFCLAATGFAGAQGMAGPRPGPEGFGGPPMGHGFHDGRFAEWWKSPRVAQAIGLTDAQKQKMDDIYQQHKLKLIDLQANLDKQELLLHPFIEADQPDQAKTFAQIDAVVDARAALEKADARMLFDLRSNLTVDQWKKLKSLREERGHGEMRERGGPGMWQHRQGPTPDGQGAGPQNGPPPPQTGTPAPQGDAQAGPPPADMPGDGTPAQPAAPQM